ncbi:M1 family metallopeptidase [Brevundimonas sp. 2R-24]|uniref:Aminopeptidase N n=1 Tax=Peiella sedimenti TaxID=3061083 RepID=A0ABT8SJ13_9CAUL|nr:M1 family metallopeptidase [Caulobacteraceae bacterium XZ-24]
MTRSAHIRPGLLLAACSALSLSACASLPGIGAPETPPAAPEAPAQPSYVRDVHSYARPEIAAVTHVDLNLNADFQAKTLAGTATLNVRAAEGANEVILDVRNMDIRAVRVDGRPVQHRLGQSDAILGRPLHIPLPGGGTHRVEVDYATRPDAAALQWLSPSQTAGGQHPFLFSQGQAILTRTWVPTQDSPGIRQTYTARITVPAELRAVMSAEMLTPEGEPAPGGRKAYRFRMDNPIPPYLMAIAVGDIAFQPLGPRTGVYTEPSRLAEAAHEFADLERMVEVAEGIYGPYRWGRYDLLILPPSFPFGGMENPRLTFATPTIVAGDRSLVSLVAHELAHSWSGNLVTNAVWDDFWLNEGFTTYFENRIMEAMYGRERALMLQSLGWRDLHETIADTPEADERLQLELAGRDPDEGMSDIAYEKGAAFLRHIESVVGRENFDRWMRSYFDRRAFQPITTAGFVADIRENLIRGNQDWERRIGFDAWIHQPGVPAFAQVPQSGAFAAVDAQAQAFAAGGPASAVTWSNWSTQERQHFLGALPQQLTAAQLADLDRTLGLSQAGNSEVRFAWLQIAVRNRYEPALPSLEQFLTSQGRRKFIAPLFQSLMNQGDWGQPIARRIYAQARPGYHSVTTGTVDGIVGWTG